jgi:hypothetical protein
MYPSLENLTLRAVLALTVRSSCRILPIADRIPGAAITSRDAIGLASSFVVGTPQRIIHTAVVFEKIEKINRERGDPAWQAIRKTANAGSSAYETVSNRDKASSETTWDCANQALSMAYSAAADNGAAQEFRQAMEHDRELLMNTHKGNISHIGKSIDLGPAGELGLLWALDQEPGFSRREWENEQPPVKIIAASEAITVEQIREENSDFVCFYLPSQEDGETHGKIIDRLNEISGIGSDLDPPPALFVYAPTLDPATRLEMNILGAYVFTDKVAGESPHNADHFAALLQHEINDSLRERASHKRAATEARALQFAEMEPEGSELDQITTVATYDHADINRRYANVLDHLLSDQSRYPAY